ncbi:FAD/NAD-P-binding domain-containing protein [Trametopsis cervina]|nr:FAD/NAD-P-binding domain-containing protein [Trametopsis cervina]
MSSRSLLCLLVFAVSMCAVPGVLATQLPVCIVGAGPGGLTIAHELEAKGISTVTFDKQPAVGGKCQSYYDGPGQSVYHPLGALIFTNQTWANALPIILASGLPLSPTSQFMEHGFYYGAGSAASTVGPVPALTADQQAVIAQELQKYAQYWQGTFAPTYLVPRYTNGVPADLAVPMTQWLQTQGYQALPSIMQQGTVPYGYGDIAQTPALYMLTYFTPDVLSAFLGLVPSYNVDFHKVMVFYSSTVKGPIHVNAPVTKIDRTGSYPVVTYTQGSKSATQSCRDVVLAFPPTLDNLNALNMPLSAGEKDVFGKTVITPYWSFAVTTKIDFPAVYLQNPFEPLGAPVGFERTSSLSPVATAWSWGAFGNTLSLDDATRLLASTLTSVQAGAGIAYPTVSTSDVKAIRKIDYFPHFNSSDLAGGVYGRYNALQGQKHTYYSSGLNEFELVEYTMRAGKELVATFF